MEITLNLSLIIPIGAVLIAAGGWLATVRTHGSKIKDIEKDVGVLKTDVSGMKVRDQSHDREMKDVKKELVEIRRLLTDLLSVNGRRSTDHAE